MTGNNRANCDKSMKLGENTEFDMRNKIEYRPILGKTFVLFLDWGTCAQYSEYVSMVNLFLLTNSHETWQTDTI